jgi:hypothetical protein
MTPHPHKVPPRTVTPSPIHSPLNISAADFESGYEFRVVDKRRSGLPYSYFLPILLYQIISLLVLIDTKSVYRIPAMGQFYFSDTNSHRIWKLEGW